MKNLITLEEAREILGLTQTSALVSNDKYKRFYHPIKGTRDARVFDIDGYKKWDATLYGLIEKTKLFIEYLVHERGITYSEISKHAGVAVQSVSSHMFGDKTALKICKAYRLYIPTFDDYYGFKTTKRRRK